jgi:hypothetical protein
MEARNRALRASGDPIMSFKFNLKALKAILTSVLALGGAAILADDALAVSLSVQLACASDYYAHCSAYSPDSPQVRSCMRSVGNSLSKRCVNALIAAGDVSATEVAYRRRSAKTAAR